jgi:hypothetical protein
LLQEFLKHLAINQSPNRLAIGLLCLTLTNFCLILLVSRFVLLNGNYKLTRKFL